MSELAAGFVVSRMTGNVVVPADELQAIVAGLLVRHGVRPTDAETVARITIDADLDGRDSHGVARIPAYVEKLVQGGIDGAAVTEVVHEFGAVFVIDGHDGFGQVAFAEATSMALERSRRLGIACGSVRNTNNPGMLAAYGRMAVEDGQIAIVCCNAAPAMPPHGGTVAMLGTNPICIAIPNPGEAAPVLDMATSAVAKGTIRAATRSGTPIPADWALDSAGQPTTDPVAALEGLLLPAGGAKGAGLAMMIDLLSGLLSGGAAGVEVRGLHDARPSGISGLVITIDPAAFVAPDEFTERLRAYAARVRAVPPGHGSSQVLIPGDRAWQSRQQHLRAGIPIPSRLDDQLRSLAVSP